jgi:TonB family protein
MIKIASAIPVAFVLTLFLNAQQQPLQNLPRCPEPPEAPLPENTIRPKYPKEVLRKNVAGNVELRAVIAPDGKTKELTIIEGEPEFSKNSLDAVRHRRFQPISKQGTPVETVYRVHVRFNPLLREANGDAELESPKVEEPALALTVAEHSTEGEVHRMSEPHMVPPKPIYQPEPEFSEASREKKEQGHVQIAMVVGTDGLPRDLKVICSSIPDSNQNALEAVKQWKFSPATKDGTPVAAAMAVEIDFHLYSQPGIP